MSADESSLRVTMLICCSGRYDLWTTGKIV